jgi:hypothetical protein
MLARWSVAGLALTVFALVKMPAGGQAPAPPCPPGTQPVPGELQFTASEGSSGPTQSLTATHGGEFRVSVPASSILALTDPAIRIIPPSGLSTTTPNTGSDPTLAYADFVPLTAGPLTFNATWTQLTQENGPPCTDSGAATLTVTAPTPVKASKHLGYSFDHRAGKPGRSNEFVLTTLVHSSPTTGDNSPIRIAVRAVTKKRRPSRNSPALSLTLDPLHIPRRGVRASNALLRLSAGPHADDAGVYQFKIGVFAHPRRHGGRAQRGVAITLSQGSRKLATYSYLTSCDSPLGGMECVPLPKGAPAP